MQVSCLVVWWAIDTVISIAFQHKISGVARIRTTCKVGVINSNDVDMYLSWNLPGNSPEKIVACISNESHSTTCPRQNRYSSWPVKQACRT